MVYDPIFGNCSRIVSRLKLLVNSTLLLFITLTKEANVALFNLQTGADGVGAIGKMGPISERAMGLKIVKLDLVTEELVRGKNGFCVICVDGEVGEMIAPVDASRHFAGYVGNKKASEKKIITDVFAKGDQYFRSGDLLKRIGGYYYFIDRIGDTFRWKGEVYCFNLECIYYGSRRGNFTLSWNSRGKRVWYTITRS